MTDLLAEWLAREIRPGTFEGQHTLDEIDAVMRGESAAREVTGERMILLILPTRSWIATLWEEPERTMELPTLMLRDAIETWLSRGETH
jgi:hypothetical protein